MAMRLSGPGLCVLFAVCAGCGTTFRVPDRVQVSPPQPYAWRVENRAQRALELWTPQGHCVVTAKERDDAQIDVRVDVVVHAETREQGERWLAGIAQPEPELAADAVRLQMHLPLGLPAQDVEMRFSIEVPPATELRLFTKSGEVALRGCRGNVTVETDSGRISARLAGGRASLRTQSGPVRLEGEYAQASVHSRMGRIEVVLPASVQPVDVDLHTEQNTVQVEVAPTHTLDLEYLCQEGKVISELPIHFQSSTTQPGGAGRRYRARVGAEGGAAVAKLLVVNGEGNLELRWLAQ